MSKCIGGKTTTCDLVCGDLTLSPPASRSPDFRGVSALGSASPSGRRTLFFGDRVSGSQRFFDCRQALGKLAEWGEPSHLHQFDQTDFELITGICRFFKTGLRFRQ